MENKEERNINLIIKNEEENKDEVTISIKSIFRNLKNFFAIWIALTIIVSILSMLVIAFKNVDTYKEISSLVSFTYDGIEKGLDPSGNKFDVNTIKNPQVIEKALNELNIPSAELESVRRSISIDGIVPQDAIDKITAYKEIVQSSSSGTGALTAVEKILDTKYYPTQFKVYLNYAGLNMDGTHASALLNKILECYSNYFLDKYGYNDSLGSAVTSLDYNDYDYAEALDVFDSTLTTVKKYVKTLSNADTTRFRSVETGFTFEDLVEKISTLQDVDMDMISSYVTLNVVTKDKESLRTYYQYRIETLQRHENVCREELATISDLINSYQKNTVQIFGNGTDSINTTSTEASKEYDELFEKKISTQSDLSATIQRINLYNTRLERLNGQTVSTQQHYDKVEEDLDNFNKKVNTLIEDVKASADEYYDTVVFSKSYNILVPASSSSKGIIKNALVDSVMIVLIIDAVIFVIYLAFAVVMAITNEIKKKNNVSLASGEDNEKRKTEKSKATK